ncbi:MAG: outer membrane beta-barrel protein [Woeseiaceae bacterium]|nr:outer membrane beta-barrel protein [Woeseiaceae bacterium]
MKIRLLIVALAAVVGSAASAATFDVSTPTEFQNALTTAQANGEDDTINVQAGTYNINALGTLTYTADPLENNSLSILGADSTLVILDGGAQVPILRIDTTALSAMMAIDIEVTNMTFQNGYATGTEVNGGALSIEVIESIWTNIAGSEFYSNRADGDGGAIYIEGLFMEGLNLVDLTIQQNEAFGTAAGRRGDGGGMAIRAISPTFTMISDIDFFENEAAGFGGGLELEGNSDNNGSQSVSLYDVMFEDNLLTGSGSGGGASLFAMDVNIDLVGFVNNTATDIGGGLHLREFSRNRTINSGFLGNSAAVGGGFGTDDWNLSGVVLEHNTFTGNTATTLGGGAFVSRGTPARQISFFNNIVWGNTGPVGADIYIDDDPDDSGGAQVSEVELVNNIYSDFTTKCTEDAGCTERIIDTDNQDVDPLLTADLHLLMGSPAIDAGLDAGHPSYPRVLVDFDGDTRPFDGDGDMLATTDIGIDEYVGGTPQATDVGIAMTDSPDPVLVGGEITYSITITNNGPGDVTGVTGGFTYTDTQFVSAVVSQGSFTTSAGQVDWTVGDIANAATATATIVIQHIEGTGSQTLVSSSAFIDPVPLDPNTSNDQVTEETTVVTPEPDSADLAIVKIDTPDPAVSGGPQLDFDITVTNNGPDAATGVTVTDIVPMELVIDGATATVGDCVVNGMQVDCTIGDLAVDAEETVTITVSPDPVQASTDIDNTATVTGNEVDPVPGNNSATATTTVTPPESDMMVTVVATPSAPNVGGTVTYDITITNGGPSHNLGIDMSITLPTMGTFQSSSISQGTCSTPVSGVIDCAIGDMLSGETVTAQVVFTAPDEAVSMMLSASISGSVTDPTGGNNTDSDSVSVVTVVDIVIQGTSKGTGAFGWLELLFVVVAVIALRSMRTARLAGPCLIAAVAVMTLIPAGNAAAQGDIYVQGAFGQTDLDYSASDLTSDLANLGWTISNPVVDSDEEAWKIIAGFSFNDYTAVEAGYVSLGEVTTQFGATVAPTEIDAILADTYSVHPFQGDGWVVAGVLTWPVSPDTFSLDLKVGAFAWESRTNVRVIQGGTGSVSDKDSGTDAMYGIGMEWKLNPTWALTAEWERYKMNEWLDVPFIGVRVFF